METEKPSAKRVRLHNEGKSILRPMMRRGGNRYFWVITQFSGYGWPNWPYTEFYKTQEKAYAKIEELVKINPEKFIDDRTI